MSNDGQAAPAAESVRATVSRYTEFHEVVVKALHDQLPYLELALLSDVGHGVLHALGHEFDEVPVRGRADF